MSSECVPQLRLFQPDTDAFGLCCEEEANARSLQGSLNPQNRRDPRIALLLLKSRDCVQAH
jgi:hypothetical protein